MIRRQLANGETLFGAQTITHNPAIVEAYGALGLDFVWTDFEHLGPAPYDTHHLESLTRAAKLEDAELLVRIPESRPSLVRKVLDTGVGTLLIPRIETADEVVDAVEASRFSYEGGVGDRGLGSVRSNTWGLRRDSDYLDREDDRTTVGIMIENQSAVKNIDELLSISDLGFVFIGGNDLSVSFGHPLDTDHPEVAEAIKTVYDACRSHGVPIGTIATDRDSILAARKRGAQLIRICSSEISAVKKEVVRNLEYADEFTPSG